MTYLTQMLDGYKRHFNNKCDLRMGLTISDPLLTLTFFSLSILDVNKSKNIGPTPTKLA